MIKKVRGQLLSCATTYCIVALSTTLVAHAEQVSPQDMFFPPGTLREGYYPKLTVVDAPTGVSTIIAKEQDLLARDANLESAILVGVNVLPMLRQNPNTRHGYYSDADLESIRFNNAHKYYAYMAGNDIEDLGTHYAAEIIDNEVRVHVRMPGPYAIRVHANLTDVSGSTFEQSYTFGLMIDDYYMGPENANPMTKVHRFLADPVITVGNTVVNRQANGDVDEIAGDLNIVAQDPDDPEDLEHDGAMVGAAEALEHSGYNPVIVQSYEQLISAICKASTDAGGPISVTISAHGDKSNIWMGEDIIGSAFITPCEFGGDIAGKVSKLTLMVCEIGGNDEFMQELSNYSGAPVTGWRTGVTMGVKSNWLFTISVTDTAAVGGGKSFVMKTPAEVETGGYLSESDDSDSVGSGFPIQ